MPAATTVTLSGDQDTDALLSGVAWAVSSLTYSFPESAAFYGLWYSYDREPQNNFEALNATQKAVARSALGMYAAVANITFTELTESASVHADLRLAESDDPSTAWGYYPHASAAGGDSWYNNSRGRYDAPVKGNYAFHTFVHELGHNLGLEHGHDSSDGLAMTAAHDSMEYSVMTYRSYQNQAVLGGYTNESFGYAQSPMMYDIAAIQHMYGANYSSNAGATTYSWNPATGEAFVDSSGQGAPGANRIFMTVWDGGGTDTYDFSNYSTSLAADLRPGAWSTLAQSQRAYLGNGNYAAGNVANALLHEGDVRSIIENLRGGSAADTLIGNQVANSISGGDGADTLDGGAGNDAVYGGNGDDTIFAGAGFDTVHGEAGTDTLDFSGAGVGVATMLTIYMSWDIRTDAMLAHAWGVENVVGSAYSDYLSGDAAANFLNGGAGDDMLLGGTGADVLSGSAGNDSLSGEAGNDVLYGGTGDDTIFAGAGFDTVHGEAGTDTLDFSGAGVGVATMLTIYMSWDIRTDAMLAHAWGVENVVGSAYSDYLSGDAAANSLSGAAGDDTLIGGMGNDVLAGGAGNDTLDGEAGADTLIGGAGSDRYDYNMLGGGADTIVGFTAGPGGDRLDIRDVLYGYSPGSSDISRFVQLGVSGGDTLVSVDANGGADAFVAVALLQGTSGLLLDDMLAQGNLIV